MKRYAEAATEAKSYLAQHGENIGVLNNLKVAHFYLGRDRQCGALWAARAGASRRRSLAAFRWNAIGAVRRTRGQKRNLVLAMGPPRLLQLRCPHQHGPG